MTFMKKYWAIHLLTASVLLTGCQSAPVKDQDEEPSALTLIGAEQLYNQAILMEGREQYTQLLDVANAFLLLDTPDRALSITQNLPPRQLDDALYAKWAYIQSQALISINRPYAAKGLLESDRLESLLITQNPTIMHLLALRAELYYDLGEIQYSIEERIALATALDAVNSQAINPQAISTQPISSQPASTQPITNALSAVKLGDTELPDQQINQELIWMTLMELDLIQLEEALEDVTLRSDSIAQGWYTLAIVSKNNQRNIIQQYRGLQTWQAEWPLHPANTPLPADLALIADIVVNQPKQIAVLLPMGGRLASASKAIRDGFMAAYYTNQAAGGTPPDVRFYDVSEGDINEHYDFAVNQGAEAVIGPLSKDKISEIALRPDLPVTTLALNNIDDSQLAPEQLYQLGLGIEDEAIQVAERATKDGKKTALLLIRANSQGDRAVDAFVKHWQELEGSIADIVRYTNERDLSKIIESATGIKESRGRAKRLRSVIGAFKFEPRPRKDIDMIFLVAQPRQARQIKPLFAFHYAGNIPIYSTSSIYEGNNAIGNADLNGIQFSHLPWMFQNSPEKQLITQNKNLNARTQRLYALGVDSYYLYPRLTQLNNARNARFWGQVGTLALNEQRQFLRKQQWAIFKKGKPIALQAQHSNENILEQNPIQ